MRASRPEPRSALVSFRQLRLFESVGRLQSFRKASDECNLSQPAVTQALAKLEEQVGVTLLNRRASGSYLNDPGLIFQRRVCRFAAQMQAALVELGATEGAASVVARRLSRSKVRGLVAIIEAPSIAQAAEALGLSHASLQRAVHELDCILRSTLHRPIYHRASDGIRITQAGTQFGTAMKLAMQEIEWGIIEIEADLGSANSMISLGALPSGGSVLLASVLAEFVAAHPRVDVRIVNESSAAMLKSLRAGDVELVLGLLQPEPSSDLITEPLARTPYAIAARRRHRLLYKGEVTLQDLQSCEWVVGSDGSSRRFCFDALFDGSEPPRAPIKTSSLPVIRHLLECSDRLTIMTSFELVHETDTLVALPFPTLEPVPALGITLRAGWQPTRLHTDFIRLVRRKMAGFSNASPITRRAG